MRPLLRATPRVFATLRRPVTAAPPAGRPRPARFGRVRWLGDKDRMVVHDLDAATASCRVDDLVASGRVATFGPDTAIEARNRGFRRCRDCPDGRDF